MSNEDAVDKYIKAACDQFDTIVQHPKALQVVSEALFEEFFDEIVQGICFEEHRNFKQGKLTNETNTKEIEVDSRNVKNKAEGLDCPVCGKRSDGTKFIKHIMDHYGLGRKNRGIRKGKAQLSYKESDEDQEPELNGSRRTNRRKRTGRNTNSLPTSSTPSVNGEASPSSATSSSHGSSSKRSKNSGRNGTSSRKRRKKNSSVNSNFVNNMNGVNLYEGKGFEG